MHETAHVYDFYNGYHSYRDELISIYNAEGAKLPHNLSQVMNVFEFFAEGVAQYIYNNAGLKAATPRLYNYLSALK